MLSKDKLKAKLERTKTDATAIQNSFPDGFTVLEVAKAFNMIADDIGLMLSVFKAYGFLKETKGKMFVVLHPDQRTLNLSKVIEEIEKQIKVFEDAVKEANEIRSMTFAEKIKL